MEMRKGLGVVAAVATLLLAMDAGAATINATDRGSFQLTNTLNGVWKVVSGSYQVRALNNGTTSVEFNRNYAVFDMSSLSGTVTSATLEWYADDNAYESSAPSETLSLWDVSIDPSELLLGDAGTNPGSVFPDLGSGVNYGSGPITAADNESYIPFALNALALADIQAAIDTNGTFTLGGALSSVDGSFGSGGIAERVFRGSGTGSPVTRLILDGVVLPEPSSLLLLGVGLAGLASTGRKRSRGC